MGDITLKAMPFDSNEILNPATGETTFDRVAYSRDLADWLRTYISNGILVQGGDVLGSQLKVLHKEALTCTVKTGAVCINGRTGWLVADTDITIEMGGAQPRVDRVVAELNIPNDRGIYIKTLKGAPAAEPVPPNLTQTEDVYQIPLAQVRVNASQAIIYGVTDERPSYISNVTIGIKPPTGMDAVTIALESETASLYGVQNVDAALRYLHGFNKNTIVTFTESGTWTVPKGVESISLFIIGGGGGGGSSEKSSGNYEKGGGGGGGGVAKQFLNLKVAPRQNIPIVIGAGGSPGVKGGNSSFGDIVVRGGDAGGNASYGSNGAQGSGGRGGASGGGGGDYNATNPRGGDGCSGFGYIINPLGHSTSIFDFQRYFGYDLSGAFCLFNNTLYGGGGGGGNGGYPGSPTGGNGGDGGGGDGGSFTSSDIAIATGKNGTKPGAGGGGGGGSNSITALGGSGMQGICIIAY